MFSALFVLVLFSTFGYNYGKNEKNPARIAALINLINKYIKSHGEAVEVMSLDDLRRDFPYYGLNNRSIDYNVNPPLSKLSDVNAYEHLTAVLLSVNHNGTTEWTTTTSNVPWRRKAMTKPGTYLYYPVGEFKKRSHKQSPSASVDDSQSNERRSPDIRRFYDEDIQEIKINKKTTKDPFDEVTPFKLNYYQENKSRKLKKAQLTNNENDSDYQKNNWDKGKDEKGSDSNRDVKRSKSNWDRPIKKYKENWNEKDKKKKSEWDKPLKPKDDWESVAPKKDWNKLNEWLKTRTKDSKDVDYDYTDKTKKIKDSLEIYKQKQIKKNDKSNDDYGSEEKVEKDMNDFNKKPKVHWNNPIKEYIKKDNDCNKKAKNDWDKPLKDSWDTKKERYKDDCDKPLKDSWDTKKDRSKYDWDKPIKDSWDTKNGKFKDDSDKLLKKDSWETKKEKSWNKNTKDDWDKPKNSNWGVPKTTRGEWERPQKRKIRLDRISAEKPRYPKTYDVRPRHEKRYRGAGGIGRTGIPYVGKKGVYDDK